MLIRHEKHFHVVTMFLYLTMKLSKVAGVLEGWELIPEDIDPRSTLCP
jgi:hypothetical protein